MRTPQLNPVLARELRQRMRGRRAFVILTLYLLILSLIVWAMYEGVSRNQSGFSGPDAEEIAGLGRSMFQTLLFCQLCLVCLIVPGLTAGAVSGEHERQTLVPLQVTMLRSRSILIGKLLASLAFVVLLIVATLPLLGVTFLLGGVEPWEVLRGTATMLVVAVVFACIGLFASSVIRRTSGATLVTYGLVFFIVIGSFVVFGIQAAFTQGDSASNQLVLYVNPFMAVADVLEDPAENIVETGNFSPFTPMQFLLLEREKTEIEREPQQFGQAPVIENRPVSPINRVPFVILSLVAYSIIGAGSIALGARRLAVPRAA